jgi:hypothetical protein
LFSPGQPVTCVDGKFPLGIEKLYDQLPTEGELYVIRDVIPGCNLAGEHGEVAVYLVELRNPPNKKGIERGFNAERFAPLQTDDETKEEELQDSAPPVRTPELVPA